MEIWLKQSSVQGHDTSVLTYGTDQFKGPGPAVTKLSSHSTLVLTQALEVSLTEVFRKSPSPIALMIALVKAHY